MGRYSSKAERVWRVSTWGYNFSTAIFIIWTVLAVISLFLSWNNLSHDAYMAGFGVVYVVFIGGIFCAPLLLFGIIANIYAIFHSKDLVGSESIIVKSRLGSLLVAPILAMGIASLFAFVNFDISTLVSATLTVLGLVFGVILLVAIPNYFGRRRRNK